tara:strand:- start:898 stop:1449 length:552 start_codon:yes stop_codon:yes gene_type:complete
MAWLWFLAGRLLLRSIWQIADENQIVSKSALTILIIGLIGAILMSLGMKHLAEVQGDRGRSPYCAPVESRLGAKRVGSVQIDEMRDGDQVHLTVRARVLAGLDKRRIADSAGREVWLSALRAGDRLDAVSVVLDDDDNGGEETFEIPSPTTVPPKTQPEKAPAKSAKPAVGLPPGGSAAKKSR